MITKWVTMMFLKNKKYTFDLKRFVCNCDFLIMIALYNILTVNTINLFNCIIEYFILGIFYNFIYLFNDIHEKDILRRAYAQNADIYDLNVWGYISITCEFLALIYFPKAVGYTLVIILIVGLVHTLNKKTKCFTILLLQFIKIWFFFLISATPISVMPLFVLLKMIIYLKYYQYKRYNKLTYGIIVMITLSWALSEWGLNYTQIIIAMLIYYVVKVAIFDKYSNYIDDQLMLPGFHRIISSILFGTNFMLLTIGGNR